MDFARQQRDPTRHLIGIIFVVLVHALVERLKKVAVLTPQPEVQIRGDGRSNYEGVGRVVYACQRAGIAKISFITEPPPRAAAS